METDDKRRLYRFWKYFRTIKPLYLVVALLLLVTVSIIALRHNNQTMIKLREAVYAADEQDGDTEAALQALRQHVYGHMNTNLAAGDNPVYPPIQLKHTYERLVLAEQQKAAQGEEDIYTQAQRHCERLHPESYSGGPRVPCIQQYVADRGVEVQAVPDSLYKFDFVSPRWSPDLAGWSIVLSIATAGLLALRLVVPVVLRQLKVL